MYFNSFFFSIDSNAYWSNEYAGSVCCPGCWDSCRIPDADCRNHLEKNKDKTDDEQKV